MRVLKKYIDRDLWFEYAWDNLRVLYITGRRNGIYVEEEIKLPRGAKVVDCFNHGVMIEARGDLKHLEYVNKIIIKALGRVNSALVRLS